MLVSLKILGILRGVYIPALFCSLLGGLDPAGFIPVLTALLGNGLEIWKGYPQSQWGVGATTGGPGGGGSRISLEKRYKKGSLFKRMPKKT